MPGFSAVTSADVTADNGIIHVIDEVIHSISYPAVLTYHVVANANVRSTGLTECIAVETLSGQIFEVGLENGPMITGQTSNIILTDVQATNGVIHVLQNVIIPN